VLKRIFLLAVTGFLTVVAVAACTSSTGGEATPGGNGEDPSATGEPSNPSSGGSDPGGELPPRPRDLSVDGVEPCSLFSKTQLNQLSSELKLDRPPRSYTSKDTHYEAPTCGLEQSREPFDAVDVMVVTTEGSETWLSGDRNVDAWKVSVGDYPAVDYKIMGSDDVECVTSVDVADGQQMIVDFIPLERRDYKELCQTTEKVAAMALQTLQSLK
jgi:uncharacterized protein DUF3558